MVGPPPESWAVLPSAVRTYELVPGLWSLRLPLPWDHIPYVNAYAVARDDGIMLVDCGGAGDPSAAAALEQALTAIGTTVEQVRLLAATHTHSDHVGMAQWVLDRSGAEFWMHPDTGHFYDAMRRPAEIAERRRQRARQEGVPAARLETFADVREETEGVLVARDGDRRLVAGVRLPSALGEWEVIETPGHSPSHVGLVQRDRGLFIAGDLVSFAFAPYFDYGYSADPVGEFLASLDAVAALGPIDLALPGHGRPLDDLPGLLDLHRAGVAQRLDQVRAALGEGPAGAYAVLTRIFGADEPGEAAAAHLAEVSAYLRHLRLRGEVDREQLPDGSFRHRLLRAG